MITQDQAATAQSTKRIPAISQVMHPGVIKTPPRTPLHEVAAQLALNRVHCVVVEGLARGPRGREELTWGILSDLDLVKAMAADRLHVSAGEVAASEVVTVVASAPLERVSQLMAEHECTHLVVVSPESGEPIGVISSLDVAGVLARSGSPTDR